MKKAIFIGIFVLFGATMSADAALSATYYPSWLNSACVQADSDLGLGRGRFVEGTKVCQSLNNYSYGANTSYNNTVVTTTTKNTNTIYNQNTQYNSGQTEYYEEGYYQNNNSSNTGNNNSTNSGNTNSGSRTSIW